MAALLQFIFSLLLIISLATRIQSSTSETNAVKQSLVNFMDKLSPNFPTDRFGWNMTSDPCLNQWLGVGCDRSQFVTSISLGRCGLSGTLDAESLCSVKSLAVLILANNTISGGIPESIGTCTGLRTLDLGTNRLSGSLPGSILRLRNLKALVIRNNDISGEVPEGLAEISSLRYFVADNNSLSGRIPGFDFGVMVRFDVSNNEFSGPVPEGAAGSRFGADFFAGNPGLCGQPVSNSCRPPVPSPASAASLGSNGLGLVMMVSCSSLLFPFI